MITRYFRDGPTINLSVVVCYVQKAFNNNNVGDALVIWCSSLFSFSCLMTKTAEYSSSSNYYGWQLSLAAVVVWMGRTLL